MFHKRSLRYENNANLPTHTLLRCGVMRLDIKKYLIQSQES